MNNQENLNHTAWDCKYHIVWIPKYRKKRIFTELRPYLGEIFRSLSTQRKCKIEEGHIMRVKYIFSFQFHQSFQSRMLLAISKVKVQ